MVTPLGPDPAGPLQRPWSVVLDRLEDDLGRLEQAITDGEETLPQPWETPRDLGPPPDDLLDRARAVLDRQRQAMRELTRRIEVTVRQRALVDGLDSTLGRNHLPPVYVDVSA